MRANSWPLTSCSSSDPTPISSRTAKLRLPRPLPGRLHRHRWAKKRLSSCKTRMKTLMRTCPKYRTTTKISKNFVKVSARGDQLIIKVIIMVMNLGIIFKMNSSRSTAERGDSIQKNLSFKSCNIRTMTRKMSIEISHWNFRWWWKHQKVTIIELSKINPQFSEMIWEVTVYTQAGVLSSIQLTAVL